MIGAMVDRRILSILHLIAFICVFTCRANVLPAELDQMATRKSSDQELASGISYHFRHYDNPFRDGPVAVYFLVIDWKKTPKGFSLGLVGSGAKRRKPSVMGAERYALAAVNGGYHLQEDPPTPYMTIKIDGVVTEGSQPGGDTSLAFHPGRMPVIESYSPALLAKYENLISGDGVTGFHGQPQADTKEERQKARAPHTFIGQNSTNKITVIAVADGRTRESIGVDFVEECALVMPFGCQKVVSLDGGGSSVMALRKNGDRKHMTVMNQPDTRLVLGIPISLGERAVSDAVLLLDKDSEHVLPPLDRPRPLTLSLCGLP